MTTKCSLGLIVGIAIFTAVQPGRTALAQSGTRTYGSRPMTHEEFQRAFWRYLSTGRSAYRAWGPFPGHEPGIYEGQAPHGAFLRMYANSVARSNAKSLPHGSIIVKENYGQDRQTLMAVTVMYRSRGYDAAHRDWYWIKYRPNGQVDRTSADQGNRPIAGRVNSCIDCHSGADGEDYTFANDGG